jgi:hypothetical protein
MDIYMATLLEGQVRLGICVESLVEQEPRPKSQHSISAHGFANIIKIQL